MSKIPTFAVVAAVLALGLGAYATESAAVPMDIQGDKIKNCAVITSPGFYRLVANLPAGGGLLDSGDCIVVGADDVTIDLAGFELSGNGAGDGITDDGTSRLGTVVRNGSITGFNNGINLALSVGAIVEHVRAIDSDNDGVVGGPKSIITGNIAIDNRFGINGGENSIITGNVASGNSNIGINARKQSIVSGNIADDNSQGISALEGSTISDNIVSNNSAEGIIVLSANTVDGQQVTDATVTGNTVNSNTGIGIRLGGLNTVSGNTANNSIASGGITVVCPSNLIGNTALNNFAAGLTITATIFGKACNQDNNLTVSLP